jgi:glycosyltransferase involved in cell wall biosynthesis
MRIILCVTNDIVTDCRVNRIARSLMKMPADVLIIGTSFPDSMPLSEHGCQTRRLKMLFKKGPLFYAEYNLRLFFLLIFQHADMLVANDLDTLLAVFLASRLKALPAVYDSHEYFTELPELVGRKWVRKIWESIEAMMLPSITHAYTVSASIAKEYKQKYGINMEVIRNLPYRIEKKLKPLTSLRNGNESIIIYQGSLNMGRGLELAIRAMQFTNNVRLIIAGAGYLEHELRQLTKTLALQEKIHFAGRLSPDELRQYTAQADLGISLEENLGLSYYYALPNKLFDYIQARIPVLVSDLPEMAGVVHQYEIGKVISTIDPRELARTFTEMLTDRIKRNVWLANLEKASAGLCWENEEKKLAAVYHQVIACTPEKSL